MDGSGWFGGNVVKKGGAKFAVLLEFWEGSSSEYTRLILDSASCVASVIWGNAELSTALHRETVQLPVTVALGWREPESMAVVDRQRNT
jgi:hypothetical protein